MPHADIVSTTTHKTLRGPRGGLVLCKAAFAKELDKLTFPGTQGGPLVHTIAAKAVCLKEAMEPSFKEYQKQVVANAKALAAAIAKSGFRIVTGGTDNHVFLVEVHSRGITGSDAEKALDRAGITVNKNSIPFDPLPPMKGGGIRLGSPSVTTRGNARSGDGADRRLDWRDPLASRRRGNGTESAQASRRIGSALPDLRIAREGNFPRGTRARVSGE